MRKKSLLYAAVAVGAGLAIYTAFREKEPKEPEFQKTEKTPVLSPISSLISRQKNLDKLDRAAIRKWFLDETGGDTGGKTFLIMRLSEPALKCVGYYLDMSLDQTHYLLGIILDNNSSQQLTCSLVNFSEIETALHDLLETGDGIIKVLGERRGAENNGTIEVEHLDFPTLKKLAQEKLEGCDGESRKEI